MNKWRHEYKYYSPENVLKVIQFRVESLLEKDSHAGEKGFYHIRSIYFDDYFNSCYYENENGTDPREKFRIRIYNNSVERITLELKQKQNGKCLRKSCSISFERVKALMNKDLTNEVLTFKNSDCFLYKKFYSEILMKNLHPVNIVCYDRIPFVNETGNVRITFDRNIRSGIDFLKFFDDDLPVRPILQCNTNLIEVKFDELLPDYINNILQTGLLKQTSFSKYYLCRKFGMNQTI